MAVSSIFHNVILDTPEKADAFIRALEASEALNRQARLRIQCRMTKNL